MLIILLKCFLTMLSVKGTNGSCLKIVNKGSFSVPGTVWKRALSAATRHNEEPDSGYFVPELVGFDHLTKIIAKSWPQMMSPNDVG